MAQRIGRGFIIYNSTKNKYVVNVYVSNDKLHAFQIQLIPQTYSKTITFNPKITPNETIVFEVLDGKSLKIIGVAITTDEFIYDPYGECYLLDLKLVNKAYVLETRDIGYSSANFYNSASVIAKFEIYELPPGVKLESSNLGKLYYQSSSKAINQADSVDLTTLRIPDMTLIATKANVTLGLNDTSKSPIIYSAPTGRVAAYKLTGTTLTSKLTLENRQ